jgi:hypothetical protein
MEEDYEPRSFLLPLFTQVPSLGLLGNPLP